MSFQRKDGGDARGGNNSRNDGRQNGNTGSFRTDAAISGAYNHGERVLQKWKPDGPSDLDGSLESMKMNSSNGQPWDQFAENERRFGLTTDYHEDIYTTSIDKTRPDYKQRAMEADRKAREIERSSTNNAHVAEERIQNHVGGKDNGEDEEDKYSGVRRQQDFPPLTSSNNKYTPPARRALTAQSTVSGAPVDPAIISSLLARPDKPAAEPSKAIPAITKPSKPEASTPPTTSKATSSATPEPKTATPTASAATTVNATATVERDLTKAFKTFANGQRSDVERLRTTRMRNDKELKLNDLKKFADSFKLNTPVPSDLVSIITKDPAKQKEIQEKAKRNAEEMKANPNSAKATISPVADPKPAQRPAPTSHSSNPANPPTRQTNGRNPVFTNAAPYNRGSSQAPPQALPNQQSQSRVAQLGQSIRGREVNSNKISQPSQAHEARLPPTGPANSMESRRSSGVGGNHVARLNPNSSEFRPNAHAATFSPQGNPSSASSPRSAANAPALAPITRSLLRRKPTKSTERAKLSGTFDALSHIKTVKPGPEKKWDSNGGMKPAYDTPPAWRQAASDEKAESTMLLTYTKLFEMAPFPAQQMASPGPAHVMPQQPHQHQLPFHLQQGVHGSQQQHGRSPRVPPMNLHGGQHPHGPTSGFNGQDDHRMMPSLSAQSYNSPRPGNLSYASPINQPAQMAYQQPMMPYGVPPMHFPQRSMSQNPQFMPQQGGPMGPIMMQNPAGGFLAAQGMPPGPMMYAQGQPPFIPQGNGHPPPMANGFPNSPGRAAPMMMSQGSQQGHPQAMYMNPGMNPGMSPALQYQNPVYSQQAPSGGMPMRNGYGGQNQFGSSPQQTHNFNPQQQHRNNHQNGSYGNGNGGNGKHFQSHNQHPNGSANNPVPTGPQARAPESSEESK